MRNTAVFLLVCACLFLAIPQTEAAELRLEGSWPTFELNGPYGNTRLLLGQTGTLKVSVIRAVTDGGHWRIGVKTTGIPPEDLGFRLSLRRCGEGQNASFIQGGEEFLELAPTGKIFLCGMGDVFGIPLQLKLECLNSFPAPGNYPIGIQFSMEAIP